MQRAFDVAAACASIACGGARLGFHGAFDGCGGLPRSHAPSAISDMLEIEILPGLGIEVAQICSLIAVDFEGEALRGVKEFARLADRLAKFGRELQRVLRAASAPAARSGGSGC